MAQGKKEVIKAVALFEVENNNIKRYDICIPDLFNVKRSGIHPN